MNDVQQCMSVLAVLVDYALCVCMTCKAGCRYAILQATGLDCVGDAIAMGIWMRRTIEDDTTMRWVRASRSNTLQWRIIVEVKVAVGPGPWALRGPGLKGSPARAAGV